MIHVAEPDIKIGVLADLSASALFLYLSFQDPETYSIREGGGAVRIYTGGLVKQRCVFTDPCSS